MSAAAVPSSLSHDGFALIEQFLGPIEVATVLAAVRQLLGSPRDGRCIRPHNTLVPLRWHDEVVQLMLASQRRIASVRQCARATDLRWISGYVSVKEAASPPLWWHQDWWCWDHPVSFERQASQIAVLCYLSDTDAGSGALRVLPGSHASSPARPPALPDVHRLSEGEPDLDHSVYEDHPEQVTLPVKAGDAVVIDYRLLHGTHANGGESDRWCVLLNFAPRWAQLPDDIKAHLIRHPSLPHGAGALPPLGHELLPAFSGTPLDLPLNRRRPDG